MQSRATKHRKKKQAKVNEKMAKAAEFDPVRVSKEHL
jgi:hypothetical protein